MRGRRHIFVLLMALLPFVGWSQTGNEPLYREGQVIVKFKAGSNKSRGVQSNDVNTILRLIGGNNAKQLMPLTGSLPTKSRGYNGEDSEDNQGLSGLYVLQFDKTQSVENTIERLKKLGYVEYAEPNYIVRAVGHPSAAPLPQPEVNEVNSTPTFNDPKYSEQWGLQAINMPALWEKPVINSKRPIIAILDTGVDTTHPDLVANIWTNTTEKGNDEDCNGYVGDIHGWDFVNNKPDVSDPNGHGTHCAGIAAAVGNNGVGIVGANPDALIMPLTVLDEGGSGDVATTILAMDYAVANGADIISMSFARSCPGKSTHEGEMEAMEEAAKYAILVAAAGNDGVCMNQSHQNLHGSGKFPDPYFPAAYPFVIGVQASAKDGSLADLSNFDCRRTPAVTVYGDKKTPLCYEILAPGVDIVSTLPSGEYGAMEGTSMSCPLIAGAVSRILQTRTDIDNYKLLTMISLVSDNKVLDVIDLYNVNDNDLPKHAVDDIFTAVVEGNEITFRVTSATTVQVGDGSYPAVNNPLDIVTIPEIVDGFKVTAIGSYAFNCAFVDKVVMPNSIIFIANHAFESSHITSVSIPESVVDIGENAFFGSHITSVLIPQNVECVSEGAFSSIPDMKSIQVVSNNKRYNSNNNCNAIIETASGTLITGIDNIPEGVKIVSDWAFLGKDFESITIPNTVEEIGTGAFENCKNLKSIDLPESVVSIGFPAFNMCEGLKSVHLSKSVRDLGSGAFGFCQNIESFTIDSDNPVFDSRENCNAIIETATNTLIHGFNCTTIPSTLEGIAYNSFYYCDKLESIYISKSVSRIDYCPFIGCHNLRSVVIDKDNPYYDSRDNCSAIIESATSKFLWGNEYSSIPSGVKILGHDAFWGAEFSAGAIIKVPEGVKKIEHGSLNIWVEGGDVTFHIPSTIKHIDEYASQYEFKSLYCYRKTPLPITNFTFREISPTATLYVPKGQKAAYENAKGWKLFSNIVEMDVEGVDPPIEIEPIVESENTTFGGEGSAIDEETDLTNVVIENTYYTMDADNGDGYDADLRALVLNSTTTDEQMETVQNAKVGEDVVRENYSGIIFEVPAGKGVIAVDFQTIGTHALNVQIGKNDPKEVTMSKRGMVDVNYNVSEPTYVYLYASSYANNTTSATRSRGVEESSVLLYGYMVILEDSGSDDNSPVSIKISSAKQVTYMSDKNLDFTAFPDLKAYVATGYDKASGTIWLTRVKEVPANTGILLMGEAATYEVPAKTGDATSYYQNLFKGTIEGTTIYTTEGSNTNYYLSNGDAGVGFYKVTKEGGQTIGANRAYLSVPTEIPTVGSTGGIETIKVSAAGQVPYCNSQSLDFSSLDAQGVKAYTATGYDYSSGTIWLTRVKQVPAETGILIMAPQGEYPVPTASVASVYANMFKGTLTGTTIQTHETIAGEDYINYYLSNGVAGVGFYRVTKEDGVTIGANRCYLPIKNKETAGTRSESSGQSQIAFQESDEVIGIRLMRGIGGDDDTTNLTPALSEGEGEGEWYTLQGQRVEKPGKGLYIRNGKKVIVK